MHTMQNTYTRLLMGIQTLRRAIPTLGHPRAPSFAPLPSLQQLKLSGGAPMAPRCLGSQASASASSSTTLGGGTFGTLTATPTVPPPPPLVMVVSGPSGVGKDAVIRRLQELRPDLYFVVTATSRPMRPGEKDGVDYFFVSREKFEEWIAQGRLLEHAVVYGEYKGIPRQQVEDALARGTDVVLRIDVQGAATMRKLLPGLVTVFLVAESEKELVERLVARKTEPEDKMKIRIETARKEMAQVEEFDYVVVNKDGKLDETVEQIGAILQAEKAKVARRLQQHTGSGSSAV